MSLPYEALIFDFDGTIADSELGIERSVQYALKKLGIDPPSERELRFCVGPPLLYSFPLLGVPEGSLDMALKYYRERYSVKGMKECSVFPGVRELLEKLRKNGFILAVATAKPEMYVVPMLKDLGLFDLFDRVKGITEEERHETKQDVMRKALPEGKRALMVGDRIYDIEGARELGLVSVGAAWGFGGEEELIKAKADYIVRVPNEICDIAMGLI